MSQKTQPLRNVIAWELRRVSASRATWISAASAFCLFLLVLWVGQSAGSMGAGNATGTYSASVAGTSAWGLALILPSFLLIPLAFFLPFVSTDGVALDPKRRTHEILMTTALPGWAYIWGRYLAMLLLSLGLAVLLLTAIMGMGLLLHLTRANYPAPEVRVVAAIWAIMTLPITILLSSLGFALGSWLPRHTNQIRVAMIVFWLLVAVILPAIPTQQRLPDWYLTWEPTSLGMGSALANHYAQAFPFDTISSGNPFQGLEQVEQRMPDLSPWLWPHLVWVGVGLALVMLAAITFKRFRNLPTE